MLTTVVFLNLTLLISQSQATPVPNPEIEQIRQEIKEDQRLLGPHLWTELKSEFNSLSNKYKDKGFPDASMCHGTVRNCKATLQEWTMLPDGTIDPSRYLPDVAELDWKLWVYLATKTAIEQTGLPPLNTTGLLEKLEQVVKSKKLSLATKKIDSLRFLYKIEVQEKLGSEVLAEVSGQMKSITASYCDHLDYRGIQGYDCYGFYSCKDKIQSYIDGTNMCLISLDPSKSQRIKKVQHLKGALSMWESLEEQFFTFSVDSLPKK